MSEYIKKEDVENIMLCSWGESALWKLRYLPAADVVEVRHGRWLDRTQEPGWPDAECSVCGSHAGMFWMSYCPNCGARMDGKEQEHE